MKSNLIVSLNVLGFGLAMAVATAGCGKKAADNNTVTIEQKLEGPLRDAQLESVTKEYGPLVLSAQDIGQAMRACSDTNSDCLLSADARRADGTAWIGWSSYWLPLMENYLFEGEQSPLKKYDRYVSKNRSAASRAADFEASSRLNYDPSAQPWEGRCNAWALASLMELPPRALPEAGLTDGDMRALVVKTYETYDINTPDGVRVFGENQARPGSDIRDILPDQLLRFAQAELFEKGRPFIIDADKDAEVWNQPIWGVDLYLEKDPQDPNALLGKMWFRGAGKLSRNEREMTFKNRLGKYDDANAYQQSNIEYEFRLKGKWRADGAFEAKDSEWTGHSIVQHPDFVVRLPTGPIQHGSLNEQISNDVVAELLAKSRR